MPRKKDLSSQRPDWLVLAQPYDHHLDNQDPFWTALGDATAPHEGPHFHRGLELGIVLSGEIYFESLDYSLQAQPGDIWLFPMWERHIWRNESDRLRDVILIFLPQVLQDIPTNDLPWVAMFSAPPQLRPRIVSPEARAAALAVGEELFEELKAKRPGWHSAVWSGLVRLLLVLSRDWQYSPDSHRYISQAQDALARIAPALELVRPDLGQCASAEEAATACLLSLSRFHYIFREALGLSYGEFCWRARLAVVAHLLISTDEPVDAIARKLDFVDGSHLHRRFLAQYSCTPSDYRRRNRVKAATN
jgi:AraC-like DNA-binding protein